MKLEELLAKLAFKHPPLTLRPDKTVLLLIDMQKLAMGDYLLEVSVKAGIPEAEAREALADLDARLRQAARNAKAVLEACRQKGIRPIHVKIQSYAADGSDVGRLHRIANFIVPPGTEWGEFIDEVKPLPGEIVLTKTCSGVFTGTMLNQILRNMGIEEVIIVGFYTDQCVTTAARDSADLGYATLVVEDATMAELLENHEHALRQIVNVYVLGASTAELVQRIQAL